VTSSKTFNEKEAGMKTAFRFGLLVCSGLSLPGPLMAQDPGTPFPPGLTLAYMYNNTEEPIRYVICSSNGVNTATLLPGHYNKFSFEYVNRPRILSVFSLSSSGIISSREIELYPQHYYLALPDMGPGPVAAPGQPKGPVPLKGTMKDKGVKEAPKGAKEAPPSKVSQEKP
jgi:hypothetical protein